MKGGAFNHYVYTHSGKKHGVHQNANISKQGGGDKEGDANARVKPFSIKYLVHKLNVIVTRFFVSFIKIRILLNLFVIRKHIFSLCLKLQLN